MLGYTKRLRERLVAAETALAEALTDLENAQRLMRDRAVLIGITSHQGNNRFTFVRNGQTYQVDTFRTMEDTPEEWKRALLGPMNHDR